MFEYLFSKKSSNYDRDNFDSFLKKVSFSYKVPSIHITGTNGKGQTASFISSIYEKQGYKVALYMSPYFKSPLETIMINHQSISEERFISYLKEYRKLFDKFNLTEFEIETFIALKYFNDEKCDIGIIECGMGGEIDATNIFDSILSIITSIDMEHTSVLGRTIGEIALHKAGIIKENSPVLIDEFHEEAITTIAEKAEDLDATICYIGKSHNISLSDEGYTFDYGDYKEIKINRQSLSSVKNALFAIEAVHLLKPQFPVDENNIKSGLLENTISGRFETFKNLKNVIVDGAHNPEACKHLINDVENISHGRAIHILFASFKDKNISNMLTTLSILTNDITLTEFDHERCRKQEDYFLYIDEYKYEADFVSALNNLITTYPDDLILVTGSLAFAYLVSDLIKNGEFNHE